MVHVLPEKIAHKRHHPQFEAIRTLCLLSLVFGGLLWPIAWLWAYTKPVGYKMAYGTDKHPDYFKEHGPPGAGQRAPPTSASAWRSRRRRRAAEELDAIRAELKACARSSTPSKRESRTRKRGQLMEILLLGIYCGSSSG